MNLYRGITGEALELVQKHRRVLDRLPRTFLVSLILELERWPMLFEPEKAYFRLLLQQFTLLSPSEFEQLFTGLAVLESQAGCDRVAAKTPKAFQDSILTLLRTVGLYSRWRQEIDDIFQKLQPTLESQLYSGDKDARLVVILYGEGIAVERDNLWKRFRGIGIRISLDLGGTTQSDSFLYALFTGNPHGGNKSSPATLFHLLQQTGKSEPTNAWIVEAGDMLHTLCQAATPGGHQAHCATGMSYDRLQSYRDELSKALYSKVLSGIAGPLELAAYAKALKIEPREGSVLYADDVVLAFIRDILLGGNGTLIISNSFVEWASVQALKRAQPRILVARFGVRDKMKPFSSLLLFSKPRSTDQIPILQDPVGSFVDVELLSYYIWLNAEKGPPYRQKTLYLLLAEGVDEMLAIIPGAGGSASKDLPVAALPDVTATMAHWLGFSVPGSPGQVIKPLVS